MDDSLSIFLEVHNSFGFPPGLVSQGRNLSKKTLMQKRSKKVCDDPGSSTAVYAGAAENTAPSRYPRHTFELAQEDIPDFISDQGTPNSSMSSLITPTQPLPSTFIFPSVYEYPTPGPVPSQPFPSGYIPSANPSQMPFSIPSHIYPPPYQPTWHTIPQSYANGYANHHTSLALPTTMPDNNVYGGVQSLSNPTFHLGGEGMYHPLLNELDGFAWQGHSTVPQASDCDLQDNSFALGGEPHQLPKGKSEAATTAGPNRVERQRKRRAPYRVDKDHEGARIRNYMSQQAFQSEIPGYENVGHNDKAPKSTTKRSKRKPLQLPAADHRATGSSVGVDRSLQARTHPPTPPSTTSKRQAGSVAAPPDPKCATLTIIRRHARLKKGFTFINTGGDQGWI